MKKLLFGLSLATLASIASAEGTLTGVEVTKVGDGLQVKVTGDDLAQPKTLRLLGGKSFMLEFDARLAGKATTQKVNYGGVSTVGAYWFQAKPAKVRVQIKLDPDAKIAVNQIDGTWMVDINNDSAFQTAELNKVPQGTEPISSIVNPLPAPVAKFIDNNQESNSKILSKLNGENDEMARAMALLSAPDGTPIPGAKSATKKAEVKVESKKATVKEAEGTWTPQPQRNSGVNLQFENTDVVLVLKALAMQTGANIVTAPDVKGQVTVSLSNVSVEEALSLICSLSGLHYAKRNNTWVVAASSQALRGFGAVSANSETRVVPIYSGEGTQIKAAVLKSVPVDNGGFEMVLPSEQLAISSTDVVGDNGVNAGSQAGGSATGADNSVKVQQATNTQTNKKDTYVVVIGPANKLDMLENQIKAIDRGICDALGIEVPSGTSMVRQTYRPKGTKAAFLLQALGGNLPAGATSARIGNVEVNSTPITSISDQVVTFYGRETEVRKLMENAMALDQVGEGNGDFLTYDVKFSDPRAVKQELEAQFPGLQVSIMPGHAAMYNQFVEKMTSQASGGGSASSETQGGSTATQGEQTTELAKNDSLALPFTPYEKTAFPMKLVLRGNRENLGKAMRYLSQVDVSPKQVAIELRVMDLTKEDARKIGLDWNILTGGSVSQLRFSNGNGAAAGANGSFSGGDVNALNRVDSTGTGIALPGGSALNILGMLDDSNNNRNLIARPNLMGLDGRQSELFVGDVIRYIESIQATQNGITVTAKDLPVGVRFSVLPRIGGDGKITLDLRPVVSALTGFTAVPGGGNLPQTSLRVVQETAVVNDGETIAIGGLIQKRNLKEFGGIPFLKDLPLIGRLFSRETTVRQSTEVVFFLTTKIIDKEGGNRISAADPTVNGNYVEPKKEEKKKGGN